MISLQQFHPFNLSHAHTHWGNRSTSAELSHPAPVCFSNTIAIVIRIGHQVSVNAVFHWGGYIPNQHTSVSRRLPGMTQLASTQKPHGSYIFSTLCENDKNFHI